MAHDINRWIFQIPLEDVRTEQYYDNEDKSRNPCFFCGKNVKTNEHYVHYLANGSIVSTDQTFDGEEDMGFFVVGSDCANKVPNNFTFKDFPTHF